MDRFSDFRAVHPAIIPPASTRWWGVREWSLGGNDRYGDCTCCAPANLIDLTKTVIGDPQTVAEGEVERFYAIETGWTPIDPATDKGAILATVLTDFLDHGWPADPTYRPDGLWSVETDEIAAAVYLLGGVCAWAVLPLDDDGGASFSDAGLGAEGKAPHAFAIVGYDDEGFDVVTWGEMRRMSRRFWDRFGKEAFGLLLPDWTVPT